MECRAVVRNTRRRFGLDEGIFYPIYHLPFVLSDAQSVPVLLYNASVEQCRQPECSVGLRLLTGNAVRIFKEAAADNNNFPAS